MKREQLIALHIRARYENAVLDGDLLSDVPYINIDKALRVQWYREAVKATRWPYMVPWKKPVDGVMRWVWEEYKK